ncbi:MAG: hypothetical protein SF123_13990 [Chloroflexota bacterium]|nr:hypothetical protein [Chloroflexota bacterium]
MMLPTIQIQPTATFAMTPAPDVHIHIDDRVRLMSAVLSVTRTIDELHTQRPHSAHAHARATRKHLVAHKAHPAVQSLQTLIDQKAPMEAIFGYALRLKTPEFKLDHAPRWAPAGWDEQLGDFFQKADLPGWWSEEQLVWEKSVSEVQRMFRKIDVRTFLKPFVGATTERFVFLPNICYPSEYEVGVRVNGDITCIAPPRAAWGDSPPWPFDEDAGHIYRATIGQYARLLMTQHLNDCEDKLKEAAQTELPVSDAVRAQHPQWIDQFLSLFITGVVAIYLEDHVSPIEAKAYTMIESKVHGNAMLPGVVSVLRRYLKDQADGKYAAFCDFIPLFPKQLRVAKRVFAL